MIARAATGVADVLGRTSVEVLLVRLAVAVAGLAALLLAAPAGLPALALVAVLVLAGLPALWPRGPWVTVAVLAAVTGWLVDTGAAAWLPGLTGVDRTGQVPAPGRLLLLAGLLYLLHTLAALAATLPYDAVMAPDVLARWLLRAFGVVLAAALLSAAVLVALGALDVLDVLDLLDLLDVLGGGGYLVATLAGLAVAAALVSLLARRGRGSDHG